MEKGKIEVAENMVYKIYDSFKGADIKSIEELDEYVAYLTQEIRSVAMDYYMCVLDGDDYWLFNVHDLLAKCEYCGEFVDRSLYECSNCGESYLESE